MSLLTCIIFLRSIFWYLCHKQSLYLYMKLRALYFCIYKTMHNLIKLKLFKIVIYISFLNLSFKNDIFISNCFKFHYFCATSAIVVKMVLQKSIRENVLQKSSPSICSKLHVTILVLYLLIFLFMYIFLFFISIFL